MNGPELSCTRATLSDHLAPLLTMNVEYVSWVLGEIEKEFQVTALSLLGMPVADYVPGVIEKVCGMEPPDGIFYLVFDQGQPVAMGGLRRLAGDTGEIKRLYVRPSGRGRGLGDRLLQTLTADARGFGYRRLVLDTAPFMKAAHRLYEAAGFQDRGPYAGVEVPEQMHPVWRFMERAL